MQSASSGRDVDGSASAVMDVSLLVTRFIRAEMWRQRPSTLSVAQFHTLTFVNAYPDVAPSEVADYLMMSRAAITRQVDELERRGLLDRRAATTDRRRVQLTVTSAGRRQLSTYFAAARDAVAERLEAMPAAERAELARALELVRPLFLAPVGPPPMAATDHGSEDDDEG